jgi:CRISPR/Cas system-associated exonuclease Cas4 (RecB family)
LRVIRASEINAYLYCRRSWWYRLRGFEPSNQKELAAGNEMHYAHGRLVVINLVVRILAFALILSALVFLGIWVARAFL